MLKCCLSTGTGSLPTDWSPLHDIQLTTKYYPLETSLLPLSGHFFFFSHSTLFMNEDWSLLGCDTYSSVDRYHFQIQAPGSLSTQLHSIICQKIITFIFVTVKTLISHGRIKFLHSLR